MNSRIERLRQKSFSTQASISIERALLETEFYKENSGKYPLPILRALCFQHLCQHKTLYIGDDELIVGERGPSPKAVPTFPELTCHSAEDLHILNDRPMTNYRLSDEDINRYEEEVIPYWQGRSMRDRIFKNAPEEWRQAYQAGLFTEFMEQRAPGHTALDGTIYREGMLDFKARIAGRIARLDFLTDPRAADQREELQAMDISCNAAIIFAKRHAELAERMADKEEGERRQELLEIARICRWVPAHAPRTMHEAIQMYWFVHLGTITELNGWDAMTPGHLDHHLHPFYENDLASGILNREGAKELMACLWIKINNHTAPPKVGVTAKESGTYNDFTQINLGGLQRNGQDGSNEISYIALEVSDELHLLQPQPSIHLSQQSPTRLLASACEVVRKGYGYPSFFNADGVVTQLVRAGKSLEDAREGGTSGCIETGAFGKEAYILTGYLNVPKILEITLHNGIDPLSGIRVGLETGEASFFQTFSALYKAFEQQLNHIIQLKVRMNNYIERMYGKYSPAPFLSVVIHDCIEKGRDYYDAGPRYNSNYIQCCGIGTVTDSLSALKTHVFEGELSMEKMVKTLASNFQGEEELRADLLNNTPFYGNNDDLADDIMQRVYHSLFQGIDGQKNTKGGEYHLNMLSTTCHVYFGKMLGASANGRLAGLPTSDGTSPSQGADLQGPTAVIKSLGKMDQYKSGGTLLNQRFLPAALKDESDLKNLGHLIRTYFSLGGHHIQFNVVDSKTLKKAQQHPDQYKNLLVRVAGYSDYFVDLDRAHQEEIISRTGHGA
ncbi:trans-4-hydroxy-L-proline dehydratase [Desulfotalea psychrophila]|uniref:Probable formate C-acetyltransferase n=1 Tax=Desulfotalea psychrophila (strain LSv54 / DSM 12343) TaxID=177439 RepID=Q6AQM8_DESPS|nr:trans-4-hydroxy-L-proline dehydratase [Desulfotalea psychrophila]CAG35345.1 probable formate C-acetyltransferase [Desulfotalea psychrophila LSv54]